LTDIIYPKDFKSLDVISLPSVFLLYGEPLSGKTTKLMNVMVQKHRVDPFSYIFVGPSGFYVREFADRFLQLVGSIVRKNFYAVDQFAVEIFKEFEPQMLHINEEFEKVLLSRILENMDLDRSIKRSPEFIDDLLEVIRDVKEKGEDYFTKFPDDDIYLTVSEAYLRLKDTMNEMKLFDSFDAYNYLSNVDISFGFKGKYLFMDGFYDFSPIMSKMLKNIFSTFEEIYITCTIDERKIFAQTSTILEFVDNLGSDFTVVKQKIERESSEISSVTAKKVKYFMKIFGDSTNKNNIEPDFVGLERYPNKHIEVENLCKKVKMMLTTHEYEPGDIAIVLNDLQGYKSLFTRKLENYGIPYRIEGDFRLSESFVVNLLLLPLEVVSKGYPPELIMSMVDFGYFSDIDPVEFESIFLKARVITLPRKRFRAKDRKEEILEKLSKYQQDIKRRLKSIKVDDDFTEDELEQLKDEYEKVTKVRKGVEKIFEGFLEPFGLKNMEIEKYKALFVKWVDELRLEDKLIEASQIDQLIALRNFLTALDELEVILKSIKKKKLSVHEYRKYLSVLISSITYKPSLDFDNRVEILSLEASRFKTKRLKIFVGFNDGIYPKIKNNLFYSGDNFSEILGTRYYNLKELQQKLDLFVSMTKTTEKILFTYPMATVEGEPLLPSPFYFDIFPQKNEKDENNSIQDFIGENAKIIEDPNSISELKTEYILSNYPDNRIEEIEKEIGLKTLIDDFDERLTKNIYEIKELSLLKELVGNKFSYSKISTFENCGRKFFYRYILKIPMRFEIRFEFTPFEKGIIYHSVLSKIFRELAKKNEDLVSVYKESEFRERLFEILNEEIDAHIYYNAEIVKKIEFERFKTNIEDILERLVEENIYAISKNEVDEVHDFTPKYFETSFGYSEGDKVILEDEDQKIELVGRIDRIDVSSDNKLFLIDYKTKKKDAKNQLTFYTLSLRKLNKFKKFNIYGGCVVAIEDKCISSKFKFDEYGYLHFHKSKSVDLQAFERELLEKVCQIHSGYFNKNSKTSCYNCYFKDLCIFLEVSR